VKKILILGGSHRDIPLIKASRKLNFHVTTLGDKDYYMGHNYSDEALMINFNDLDKVRDIIQSKNIDFIIPGSGEESYINTVKLSKEFNIGNFDDYEVAKLVHNKWLFKEFCIKYNISTPKGLYYKQNTTLDISHMQFPIVVKPTNLSGGRGVVVVKDEDELNKALSSSNKISDELFLEEFISGRLIAYSVFIKDQKILYSFSGADDTYLNPYLITTAYPIKLNEKVKQKLDNDINKISETLKLVDGMFHLQIIIKDNIPYIIDVTRRIPGDLYPDLIEYCDGVKYSQAVIKGYIGDEVKNEFDIKQNQNFIIRHVVMPSKNGTYNSLHIDKALQNTIIDELQLTKSGYKIRDFLHTQLSILFIKPEKIISSQEVNNLCFAVII
jgi:biotin carboxylase